MIAIITSGENCLNKCRNSDINKSSYRNDNKHNDNDSKRHVMQMIPSLVTEKAVIFHPMTFFTASNI